MERWVQSARASPSLQSLFLLVWLYTYNLVTTCPLGDQRKGQSVSVIWGPGGAEERRSIRR